jgi:peptidyl-prolyl cis-trans isomerase C
MKNTNSTSGKSKGGNTKTIALAILGIAAVVGLGFLSTQMSSGMVEENATEVSAASESGVAADTQPAAGEETKTADATESPQAGSETPDAAKAPMEVKPGNPVVARVNDKEITRVDVLNFIAQLPANMKQMPIEQLYPLALEQVVNGKLVEGKIDSEKLAADPEVVKQIDQAKSQIIRSVFIQQEVEKQLTEDKLKAGYDKFVKEFPKTEEAKAAHILVDDEAKAKEIIAKLNDGGDFATLAKENSKDATAKNGGDLGFFAQGDVVKEFGDAAFALENGAYTKEPVKTQFGFHVIKLESKQMRKPPEFEQAKPMIEGNLRREILDGIVQGWRDAAKIERFDINGDPVKEDAKPKTE